MHLCQVVNVSVIHYVQGIDSSSEGVDLLMRVSNKDFRTALREQHIHDGWVKRKERR